MNITPKVQRIMEWREYLTLLPDEFFFDIMRMYLGEIKTPYNKQNLIEKLSAFLRKEENRAAIVRLLSGNDLKLLAVIQLTPGATEETLSSFFSPRQSYRSLYEHIRNLEERLVLFRRKGDRPEQPLLCINPMLEDDLVPALSEDLLLSRPQVASSATEQQFSLSALFLASAVSFIQNHADLCKQDGTLKKKAFTDMQAVYGTSDDGADARNQAFAERLRLLSLAFRNLQLFHEADGVLTADWQRLELFAKLPELSQNLYLVAGAGGSMTRSTLQSNAGMVLDVLLHMPQDGYLYDDVVQLALLRRKGMELDTPYPRRFGRMLSRSGRGSAEQGEAAQVREMLGACRAFGLIVCTGKTSGGEDVLRVRPGLLQEDAAEPPQNVVSIDAGFSVTVQPGLPLIDLLPIARCMEIRRYDVIAQFEMNRAVAMRAFDDGITPGQMLQHLEGHSAYGAPQNFRISLEEWYAAFSSATLYKGYVLRVQEESATLTAKNPRLARHIHAQLAPGVYLMDFKSDEEALACTARCGLDFIGSIKTVPQTTIPLGYSPLHLPQAQDGTDGTGKEVTAQGVFATASAQKEFLDSLRARLKELRLAPEQAEELSDRIDRRIVLRPEQLTAASVRFELREAGGMDYAGKIHVAEKAMQTKSLVEVELESNQKTLTGLPVAVSKKAGKAEVTLRMESNGAEKTISIGAASRIKKIRAPIDYD